MMLDGQCVAVLRERLSTESFYVLAHRELFVAILALHDRGAGADIILLRDELRRRESLKKVGGLAYLTELTEAVPTSSNAEYYAQIVRRQELKRRLGGLTRTADKAWQEGAEPQELIEQMGKLLDAMPTDNGASMVPIDQIVGQVREDVERRGRGEQEKGLIRTGIASLDRTIGGLAPGDLCLLGARPRDGKSALLMNIALNVALRQRGRVVIFDLEVPRKRWVENAMRALAGLNWRDVQRGQFTAEVLRRWQRAEAALRGASLAIDDTPGLDIAQLEARARSAAQTGPPITLVGVDYIQQVACGRETRDYERISQVVSRLKTLARILGCPLIACSQLKRPSATEGSSVLKGSGALEEQSDHVILLSRLGEFEWGGREAEPDIADRIVRVAKQKSGPEAVFTLTFNKPLLRLGGVSFPEIENDPPPAALAEDSGDTAEQAELPF